MTIYGAGSEDSMFGEGAASVAPLMTNGITVLHASEIGRVDDLRCGGFRKERGPGWEATKFHFLLPLAGAFVWHVAGEEILADANQALYVADGEEFAFSHPLGAERSLVITPKASVLEELSKAGAYARGSVVRQASRAKLASYGLQLAVHRLRRSSSASVDPLDLDELLIEAMRGLAGARLPTPAVLAGSARRTLQRAKEFLHARTAEKITLSDVAMAADVSPVYLTYLFRRAEGVPLYQYLLKLRLASALVELPTCEDITGLSLDLGFSSHSHFSAAFRSKFGVTPSAFREDVTGRPSFEVIGHRALSRAAPACPPIVFPLCIARGGSPVEPSTLH